jgi:hypothetical protein
MAHYESALSDLADLLTGGWPDLRRGRRRDRV